MKFIFFALLATALVFGFLERSFQNDRERWLSCSRQAMSSALTRDPNLNADDLVLPTAVVCETQLKKMLARCASDEQCRSDIRVRERRTAEALREVARWTQEADRKSALIELSVKNLESSGVTRDDFKSFFRSEILQDETDDREAQHEAAAANREQTTGRFTW